MRARQPLPLPSLAPDEELAAAAALGLSLVQYREKRAAHARDAAPIDYVPAGFAPAPARASGAVRMVGDPPYLTRIGDVLTMSLPFPPRTKKNSTTLGVKQSQAYRRYLAQVRRFLSPHVSALALPLPDAWYNCAALFYADNDACDTVGLMQGLAGRAAGRARTRAHR